MEESKGKYANGASVEIPEEKNELEIAIKEWSEGNSHLEEALRQCIANGIKTMASCAGHKNVDSVPYVAMEITDESRNKILSVLNTVFKNRKGVNSITIGLSPDQYYNPQSYVAIHTKKRTNNDIFDAISEGAKSEIDLDNCPQIIKKMMEIMEKSKELGLYSNILSYTNLGPARAIVLQNNTININKELYNKAKIKHTINLCLTDGKVLDKLNSIYDAMCVQTQMLNQRSR